MLKISIPTPCHEDWNKMTPDETGRHCSSCAKSVVDFTAMSDEEVQHFFLNKKEERVCGRFKQTQLQRIVIELPQNILHINMPLWKKFLAACLIVFSTTLFSCETNVKGKLIAATEVKNSGTRLSNDQYLGGISYTMDTSTTVIETFSTTAGEPVIVMDTSVVDIQGDIALVEEDTVVVIKTDTVRGFIKKGEVDATSFMQDKLKITPTKTKNPPEADSINCNTIKNYH